MSWLYSILLLGSAVVPLVLSFDKKLRFYKQWKYFLPSLVIVALFYISFDIFLTKKQVWGFNPNYHSGFIFFGLPVEEWLFFIIIPYASVFLHDSVTLYFSRLKLGDRITKHISVFIMIFLLAIILLNSNKTYTVYIFLKVIALLLLFMFDKKVGLNQFYITFLIILIPFTIVNGILTGSFINEPVVWYNNDENLGIRFVTIPIEDFFYAFSLIGFVLFVRERIKGLLSKKDKNLLDTV